MKKYAFSFLIILIVSMLAVVLFSNSFESVDSLMKPPKLEGENLKIQLAFESTVGTNYILKSPIKGKYRSAYTFVDLSGDKDNEAIVFYSKADEIGVVRMNVLDEVDGEWVSIADFESVHNEIQQVEFADINGDKVKEIIAGWATYQSDISKSMSIYEFNEDADGKVSIALLYNDTYSEFSIIDIDFNGVYDILNLKLSAANGTATEYVASFLKYGKDGVFEKGFVPLDLSISSVKSVTSDKAYDYRRIFIDGYKVDSGMATDCFYWSNETNEFRRYLYAEQSISNLTSRSTNVYCTDINDDTVLEIPIEEALPASTVLTAEKSVVTEQSLIKWTHIGDKYLKPVSYHLINSNCGYSFEFDENWRDKVTVENNVTKNILTFYALKKYNGVYLKGKELFSLLTFFEIPLDRDATYNYKYLGSSKGRYYYYRIYDEGEKIGITRSIIKNNLIFS